MIDDPGQSAAQRLRSRSGEIAGFCVVGLLSIYLALLLPADVRLQLFIRTSVPWAAICLVTTLIAVLILTVRSLTQSSGDAKRKLFADLTLALAVTTLIAWQVPFRAFLENDESMYQATADAIRLTGSPVVPQSGIYDGQGVLHPTATNLEKRGVFYPLLLALTAPFDHAATRGALVNLVASGLLFLAFARLLRRLDCNSVTTHLGVLLLASFPILSLAIRSGLYDTPNIALLIAMTCCVVQFRKDATGLNALAVGLLGACAAQVRYESLIPAALAIIAVVAHRVATPTRPQIASRYKWLPLLLVPGTWRLATPLNLELPDPVQAGWGLDHFLVNTSNLLQWMILPSKSGNLALSLLALFGVVACIRARSSSLRPSVVVPILILLSGAPLLLYSYWGQIGNVATSRYFIPSMAVLAVLAAQCVRRWLPQRPVVTATTIFSAVAMLLYANHKSSVQLPLLSLPAHRDNVLAELSRHYGDCNVLLVTAFPPMFVTRGRGAISEADWIQLQQRVAEWAAAMKIYAVIAVSLQVPGMPGNPGRLDFSQFRPGRDWVQTDPAAISAFREIWRAPVQLSNCPKLPARRSLDATDMLTARRLWETPEQ